MSSYATIKTKMNDADLLVQTLKSMGYDDLFVNLDQPKYLEPTYRTGSSHIIIPGKYLPNAVHGVGFHREKDGTFSVVTEHGSSQRTYGNGTEWLKNVGIKYVTTEIAGKLKAKGFQAAYLGKKLPNGKLQMKFVAA